MNKLLAFLFTAGLAPMVSGQFLLPVQHDTLLLKHEVIFSGNSDYNASSLYRELSDKILKGGYISDDIKDRSFDRHHGINRFGRDIQAEIEYRNYNVNLFGNEKWGFVIKGGYYFIGAGAYSKDLFGLAFYGNERYLGKTANFSGTTANFTGFQKIGFGAISKKGKSSVVLSFVNVTNLYKGNVYTGSLVQDEAGSNIGLNLDGTFAYTEKAQFSNGIGAAVDFDFRLPISWMKDQKAFIRFQARNLGFAFMNQGLKTYSVDSSYSYSGFDFDQLLGNNTLFSGDFSLLDSLKIDSSTRRRGVLLPGFFQVGKIVDEHHAGKWQSFFGIRICPTLAYIPMVYAGANWRPAQWVDLGLSASYGGFGGIKGGFYVSLNHKLLNLGLGTEDIYGLFAKRASGQSFNLRLRCRF